jgi:hypothetical protein
VTKEADLPAIKAAVEKHNAPIDFTRVEERHVKDGEGNIVSTSTDNALVREPPP